uniref:Uncharacterized protein n=1 Tax=Mustela putorius furo TaxID=9669 RepID=M3Y328_MUSPF
ANTKTNIKSITDTLRVAFKYLVKSFPLHRYCFLLLRVGVWLRSGHLSPVSELGLLQNVRRRKRARLGELRCIIEGSLFSRGTPRKAPRPREPEPRGPRGGARTPDSKKDAPRAGLARPPAAEEPEGPGRAEDRE